MALHMVEIEPEPPLTLGKIGGLEITQVSDIQPGNINTLIYGDAGVGKTQLAGSACEVPELSPVLYMDIEAGKRTLLRKYKDNKNLHIVTVSKWESIQKVYNELYKDKDKGNTYKTVIIDSDTEVQKLAMMSRLNSTQARLPGAVMFDDENVPEIKDWMVNTEQMRKLTRAFRDLPMNVIFTALATDKTVGNRTSKWPLFTNKLSDEIPGLFDAVLYMYTQQVKGDAPNERLILTDKTDRALAKSRLINLPMVMKNPTMLDIFKYAQESTTTT